MRQWIRRRCELASAESERGSMTIWALGMLVATFLLIALLLDGGSMLRRRSEVFGTASATARVGAQQLDQSQAVEGVAVLDPIAAEQAALDYLTDHGMSGSVSIEGDRVTVEVSAVADLQMFNLIGGGGVSFTATASAQAVKVEP